MSRVVFYNGHHVGDILISKPFVKEIMKFFPDHEFYYCQFNDPYITTDLCPTILTGKINDDKFISYNGDEIIINTWFGNILNRDLRIISGTNNISHFEFQLDQFNYLFKKHGINIDLSYMDKDLSKYCWEIENKYINDLLFIREGFNVLIYTYPSKSNQADWIEPTCYIKNLSEKFPDINFYTTDCGIHRPNIINLNHYFPKRGIDLFQIAELSKKCKIIVGNGSGPLMFSWLKTNIMDPNKLYIINHKFNDGECRFFTDQPAKVFRVKSPQEMYFKLQKTLESGVK